MTRLQKLQQAHVRASIDLSSALREEFPPGTRVRFEKWHGKTEGTVESNSYMHDDCLIVVEDVRAEAHQDRPPPKSHMRWDRLEIIDV